MGIDDLRSIRGPQMARRIGGVTPQLIVGGFILAIGVVLTLDRLQLIDAARALPFWPVAFLVLGGTMLVQRKDGPGRFWGFAWLGLGGWLLLNTLGVIRVGFWELVWPLLLVLFGLSLVMQTLRRGKAGPPSATDGSNLFAVMGECKRSATNTFSGSHMTAIMGGCILDLRQAIIAPGNEAIIDVFGFMGGHEIVVPSGWVVESHIVPIAAGVEDKRLPVANVPAVAGGPAPPRLVVRGFLVLSGIAIKT